MSDDEARGLILQRIYDRRATGRFVNVSQLDDLGFDRIALDRYLTQLDGSALITLKPMRENSVLVDANIQITQSGSYAVEHPETSPPNIILFGSLHIGDRKTQVNRVGIGKIEAAMDGSTNSKVEQPKGKSLIGQIIDVVKAWFSGK
jgi:hypothetical protein